MAYIAFQLPGTLLIKQIGPARQFAGAMITVRIANFLHILTGYITNMSQWGALTAITVTIHNKGELFALRFLIGAAEAFVQGGVFC